MSSTIENADTTDTVKPFTGESIFPKGEKNEAYARYFTGTSYLNMLSLEGVVIGNVTFEPGCRNFWHIHHKGGQILLATAGRGWCCSALRDRARAPLLRTCWRHRCLTENLWVAMGSRGHSPHGRLSGR